ncbi:MAG: hypothetical protein ACT4NY_03880 [Pseudonocardiales bacterium]
MNTTDHDADEVVRRVTLSKGSQVTGAALAELRSKRVLFAGGQEVAPAAAACSAGAVTYLPGADFEHSYAAAEAQIPVVQTDEATFIDCRDGTEVPLDPALENPVASGSSVR